jgi:hypothetical protein
MRLRLFLLAAATVAGSPMAQSPRPVQQEHGLLIAQEQQCRAGSAFSCNEHKRLEAQIIQQRHTAPRAQESRGMADFVDSWPPCCDSGSGADLPPLPVSND